MLQNGRMITLLWAFYPGRKVRIKSNSALFPLFEDPFWFRIQGTFALRGFWTRFLWVGRHYVGWKNLLLKLAIRYFPERNDKQRLRKKMVICCIVLSSFTSRNKLIEFLFNLSILKGTLKRALMTNFPWESYLMMLLNNDTGWPNKFRMK